MRIIGVIAEYNPFHNGHLYQIKEIRKKYNDALIIAVVATNFTERGQISLMNKWNKTKICLENGIDIILELPTLYATQSADIFAYGALKILSSFGIDTLIFGTESDDLVNIKKLANIQLNDSRYDKLVKSYLDSGINYPSAMSMALKDITNIKISEPNDILALSYVKEIIKNNYDIEPISIKRTNGYHDLMTDNNIASATQIRKMISNNDDISKFIPFSEKGFIYDNIDYDLAYKLLKYNIINNKDSLSEYLTVDEGIENRILKNINMAKNWDELVSLVKTKRYTYNKINRMFIHILLGYKKIDNDSQIYLRVLGFNAAGQKYLNSVKKSLSLPLYLSYRNDISHVFDLEFKSTYIYSLIVEDSNLVDMEYKSKPIQK